MILVDTSVWIDHFRKDDRILKRRLESAQVATHPFVIGEIALGSIKSRDLVLSSLANLPAVTVATDDEVLTFIDTASLAGLGVGYLDAHLLAAVKLTPGASLWTRDRKLKAAAASLDLATGEAD